MALMVIFACTIFVVVATMDPVPVTSVGVGDVLWALGALILAILVAKVFVNRGHHDF